MMYFLKRTSVITWLGLRLLAFFFNGCESGHSDALSGNDRSVGAAPVVTEGGRSILLDLQGSDQISTSTVEKKDISIEVKAPARIVVSSVRPTGQTSPVLMFESGDLSDAVSDYQRVSTQLDKAIKQVERLQQLVQHEAAAGKDLIDAESDASQLRASLAQAESRIRIAGLDVNQGLHAPAGNVILVADVPEVQLRLLRPGAAAKVMFNAYPNELISGKVTHIADVIDPVTHSVKVELIVPNNNGRLLAGMYGQVVLGVTGQSAISVPAASLFTAQGNSYVFVETAKGHFERREVLPGVQGTDWAELTSGVRPGDHVVSRGTMLLKGLSFGY